MTVERSWTMNSFTGEIVNKKERDLDLKFLDEFVYACPTDGYCNLIEGIDREVHEWQLMRITNVGPHRNWWRTSGIPMKGTLEYNFCVGCFHPVGQWEARRVNDYLGHKAPSTESILDSLPEIDL